MQTLGVRKGERVAYLGYNNHEMLALLFALAKLGAILVPLNWRLTAAEHRRTVRFWLRTGQLDRAVPFARVWDAGYWRAAER